MAAEILRRIVANSAMHKVLWIASNGAEAISCCNREKPDLILMDLMMPVMDGVEATRRIMKTTPCAILVVTATVSGHSSKVFEAMGAGALDVVATPVIGADGQSGGGEDLLKKINLIGKLIGAKVEKIEKTEKDSGLSTLQNYRERYLVVLGSSTGGPQALLEVLSTFPKNINASIVVVQHMDKKFTASLATWLNKQLDLPVKIITNGGRLITGTVLIPNTDNHLTLTSNGTLCYSKEPADNFYHPSVDVFFNSVAKYWPGKMIAALLTGMGRDGAQGLLNIKNNGWHTIAQDQETSVVYGMPKAAKMLNAATEILPIQKIGPRILELLPKE